QTVGEDEVAPHDRRVLTRERDVKQTDAFRQLALQREIDLVVEHDRTIRTVHDLDAHMTPEWHRDVAVEPTAFLRGRQRRGIRNGASVWQSEEVEARYGDTRPGRAVVEHLEDERTHAFGARRRERHPDVAEHARTVE